MKQIHFYTFCLFISLFFMAGCSRYVPVKGRVTFEDGSPLTRGEVRFQKESVMGHGKIDSNGFYSIGFGKDKNGIPKGTYDIAIANAIIIADPPPGVPLAKIKMPPPTQLIDGKYSSFSESGLKCEVSDAMEYNITVVPPSKKTKQ